MPAIRPTRSAGDGTSGKGTQSASNLGPPPEAPSLEKRLAEKYGQDSYGAKPYVSPYEQGTGMFPKPGPPSNGGMNQTVTF
mmetsp:Transcript_4466/g.6684  ORF Transcript_4466/g.6684 Transcript_4466/m.6684 type:complete len:81 (-) Transcript_4466:309-551(-)